MKKKLLHNVPPCVPKILFIMRLTFLCVFLFCMQLSAKVYSQRDVKFTFELQQVKLGRALEKIEGLSDYRFFYNNKKVPLDAEITLYAEKLPVGQLLNSILPDLQLKYQILNNNVIVIAPANENIAPIRVGGTVKDSKGAPLPGVTVKIKGINKGTISDAGGRYQIEVPENGTLVFSYIGFQTQEVPVNGQSELDIVLLENAMGMSLNEVVVVGYGTQKRSQVTAAVSTLKGNEIAQSPVANINNSVAGRVSGVLAFQASGEPGADAADIRVRGISTIGSHSGALIVVDGVPRSFSQLNPNEIESITVLKDAAAIAPYGLAGANGVILVTTKRGKEGKIALSYNSWFGVQQPTRYPDYLDAYGFASTLNIARANAGLAPQYSEEELQKYKDRSDLDHYPDHDWLKEVVDFSAPMTSHSLTFTGGSEKVRFFSSLGYLYQQGSVDVINYSRYNLATNVDVNATKSTLVSLDIKGSLEVTKNPGSIDGVGIYTQTTKQPPLLSNQLAFTNGLPGNTLIPSIYNSGYNRENENIFYSQLSIEQKIPFIPGLSLKGVFAYDKNYSLTKQWQTPYTYYKLNSNDEFEEVAAGVTAPRLNQGFDQDINTTLQGYITYSNTFGKHGVNLLAVAEQRQGDGILFDAERINYQVNLDELDMGSASKNDLDNGGSSSKSKQVGFVYRASYDYAQKYLAEFSGRYDGHYYFAPGKRFAFFPAVSLGWRLSEEPFIKDNIQWIDNLKLRGSYGKSGNLAGNPFQYLSSYGIEAGYIFGGSQVQGAFERLEPNVNITWETSKKLDIGVEASLFNGKLGLEFDVFKERRSDMLVPPNSIVSQEYGIGIAQVNGGIMTNRGFDLSLTTANSFSNGLTVNGGINLSYAKNKLIDIIEGPETYNNPNRRRTGRPLDTQFGLKALGLFQSREEIDNWAAQFGPLQPGDIKYADINDDGKINNEDQVVIGDPAFPQLIYGLTGNASWKGFDLSMLWQGAGMSSFQLTNEASNPFFNGAKIFKEQLDYWTPENRDAEYPVIMPAPTPNSSQVSSWWQRDGSYLRLKNLEIGYTLPAGIMKKISLNSIRVFAAGQNLLTFSAISYLDPEIGVSSASKRARYYFQQKVYTFGLNVNF